MTTPSLQCATRQKIAVIGSGIAGMGAAYLLHPHHDITVYEKNDYSGGHARTRIIRYGDRDMAVDTGFIVFNDNNYPHLAALFKHLNVPVQKSVMSFGVTCDDDTVEWGAENLNALFGQRRNLIRPEFYKFLGDILRFNARCRAALKKNPAVTLGQMIAAMNLGDWFKHYYILPMGGAIWSCPLSVMLGFPAAFFINFFDAHGLLTVTNQPQWYTVTGGSKVYVEKLVASFKEKIKLSCRVAKVTRRANKVTITDAQGGVTEYDRVIIAAHADEAIILLDDVFDEEKTILSAFRYQDNIAVLHKHAAVMPRRRATWSSWVYHAPKDAQDQALSVTYWMNHLQNLDNSRPLFVTLNPRDPIPESAIFERHVFSHPIYDPAAVQAQSALRAIGGKNDIWFCGAYQRNGFHEDGLASAIDIAARMGITPPWL